MKRSICLLLSLAALLFGAVAPAADAPRPNIVLIMADDMGFSDIGCYGGEIETPHLDRLAAAGLRFTQFYNTSRCCPTRASLLTGLYPHQAGVGDMVGDWGKPGYRGRLNDRCVTIAEALRPAGYRTYLSGKWHVGEQRPHWPVDRGFDRSYSLVSGGTNYFRLDPTRTLAIDDRKITPPDDWYVTDAVTDHAVQFIDEHADDNRLSDKGPSPFFLYLAYTAPHWPLHARPEDISKYRGKYSIGWDELRRRRHARLIELGLVSPDLKLSERDPEVRAWEDAKMNKEELDLRMAVYAAQIDRMDQGIGRVVEILRKRGQLDNTLILFLADNGGCHEVIERSADPKAPTGTADSFRSYGRGWANASNTPFRMFKHWTHEGGIATPLIAHWPRGIAKADITHQPGHLIDLMATCLDLAGAEYPKEANGQPITPLEGKSLAPIFAGRQRDPHEAIYWEHQGSRAVRQGDWKLVAPYRGGWELYNLAQDRSETMNLAPQHPERVAAMTTLYDAWAARSNVLPYDEVRPKPMGKKQ